MKNSLFKDLLKIFGVLLLFIIINKSWYDEPLNITNYSYKEFNKDSDNAMGNVSIVMEKIDKIMNISQDDKNINKSIEYIFNTT
ncbi:MAG: hypothetical protein PHF86_10490 [Candidatus Nanoarchaeia archaeon]|nr:hypothetical protein [Candidatus Nanoarchaeia archaeon]